MSWSQPAGLAPFPAASPFAGLPVTDEVKVNRQVLAEPSADLAPRTWAALEDGTPLVTEMPVGAGRVVLFHVTANADWSNLPLSGLFVEMLRRLVQLSVGVANTQSSAVLAPAETLDGFGLLTQPPPAAIGLQADKFGSTPRLAATSARAVRSGKRAAGAEPGYEHCGAGSRSADRRRDAGDGARFGAGDGARAAAAGAGDPAAVRGHGGVAGVARDC